MESKKMRILVPDDFTEVADCAIDHAIGVARYLDAEVYLLHVLTKNTRELLNIYKPTVENVSEKMEERVKKIEAKYQFKVQYVVKEGSIFEDIAKVSEELGVSYVFMGTHGKHGIQHFIGSYAHKVITSSKAPFVVVQKKPFRHIYQKIVLPLDDSLESRQKIKWAISIARIFKAKIYIKAMYKSDEIQRYKLNVILQKILRILYDNGIEFEYEMKPGKGSFSKQVIQYAKDIDADLIIIMTDPDSAAIPSFIFSPSDEQILFNEEQIPVMCVNPRDLNIIVVGL